MEEISLISSSYIISPLLIGSISLEAVFGSHVGKKDEENSAIVAAAAAVAAIAAAAVAVCVAACCFALTFLGNIDFYGVDFELTVWLF